MASTAHSIAYTEASETEFRARELSSPGVSWPAVLGGAFVTAALYLVLLALGAGFGLSAVSPWSNVGLSATAAKGSAIGWLVVTAILASLFGGYLTGRLRTKWVQVHTDEVYFRDTANGFLAWAVALVISMGFMASAAGSMVGQAEAGPGTASDSAAYFVDALFQGADTAAGSQAADTIARAEAGRLLAHSLAQQSVDSHDRAFLTGLVAAKTGMDTAEAERRVLDTFQRAQAAADEARKATARLLLWLFVSFLLGAFSASYGATIGGRQRDGVKAADVHA